MIGSRSAVALGSAVALSVSMVGVAVARGGSEAIVVSRVVDGDTLDVKIDGRQSRVRLLNIDSPETVDPNSEVQCLGPEATKFLASLLPPGTPVTLEFDKERTDRYGRTLAGVFTESGKLVNAEIARAGLGHAVVFGQNTRFLTKVEAAQDEARSTARGLYSSDVACTVPAQVDQLLTQTEAAPGALAPQATSGELSAAEAYAVVLVTSALTLRELLDGERTSAIWVALPNPDRAKQARRIDQAQRLAERKRDRLHVAYISAQGREEAQAAAAKAARVSNARRLAAQAAASRQAAVAQARRAATADAASAAAARTKKAAAVPNSPRVVLPDPPAPAARPPAGYAGPRCYAPGGKTWTPC